MSNRLVLTTRCNHITQKVNIAGQRILASAFKTTNTQLKSLFDKISAR